IGEGLPGSIADSRIRTVANAADLGLAHSHTQPVWLNDFYLLVDLTAARHRQCYIGSKGSDLRPGAEGAVQRYTGFLGSDQGLGLFLRRFCVVTRGLSFFFLASWRTRSHTRQ